ncbi:hypothetical protein C8T65DRAFT_697210 [Cerioporus squamosus]|nr:hypothetical protein C8T65DRAFT_697210 [Cerioporus squamosus]
MLSRWGPPPKLGALEEHSIKSSILSTHLKLETRFRLLGVFTEIHRVDLVCTDRPLVNDEDGRRFNSIGDPPYSHQDRAPVRAGPFPRRVILKLLMVSKSAGSLQPLSAHPDHITGPDTLPWATLYFSRYEDLEEFNLRTRAILAIHANLFATLPASAKIVYITLF